MEALDKVQNINVPKETEVYKWIQRFREGGEDLEDDPRTKDQQHQNITKALKQFNISQKKIEEEQLSRMLNPQTFHMIH